MFLVRTHCIVSNMTKTRLNALTLSINIINCLKLLGFASFSVKGDINEGQIHTTFKDFMFFFFKCFGWISVELYFVLFYKRFDTQIIDYQHWFNVNNKWRDFGWIKLDVCVIYCTIQYLENCYLPTCSRLNGMFIISVTLTFIHFFIQFQLEKLKVSINFEKYYTIFAMGYCGFGVLMILILIAMFFFTNDFMLIFLIAYSCINFSLGMSTLVSFLFAVYIRLMSMNKFIK